MVKMFSSFKASLKNELSELVGEMHNNDTDSVDADCIDCNGDDTFSYGKNRRSSIIR